MDRPQVVSETPGVQGETREEAVADVIGASLLRHAFYRRLDGGAPWGFSVAEREIVMFYVVARGEARVEVAGEPLHVLAAGDAIFLPRGTAHTVRDAATTVAEPACAGASRERCVTGRGLLKRFGGDGARCSLIAGFFDFTGQRSVLLATLPRVLVSHAADTTRPAAMTATLQLLIAESMSEGATSTIVLQRLAEILMVHALRELAAQSAQVPHAAVVDPAIHSSLSLIHEGFARPWTVASLAKRVGMSRSTFAERFSQLVGEPPLQYLARWRMARAGELLRSRTSRIHEVAARVGYASVPSFNKAFRRWQGTTPTVFRKHAIGDASASG